MSDYTKRNIEHFDKRAATWDASPSKLALAKKCATAFLQANGVEWNPNSTISVDFACGTGGQFRRLAHSRTYFAGVGCIFA